MSTAAGQYKSSLRMALSKEYKSMSPHLQTLKEMERKYGPAMLLIAMHWPTRRILNYKLPLEGDDPEYHVNSYVYMGVI
jgi:hypothetical protein